MVAPHSWVVCCVTRELGAEGEEPTATGVCQMPQRQLAAAPIPGVWLWLMSYRP